MTLSLQESYKIAYRELIDCLWNAYKRLILLIRINLVN